jgi:hypothetical protein
MKRKRGVIKRVKVDGGSEITTIYFENGEVTHLYTI